MITGRIVENFSIKEMSDKNQLILTPDVVEFAEMLQTLRYWYDKPMKVNSWYRTKDKNKEVGGSSNSIHLDGRAVDLSIKLKSALPELVIMWRKICEAHHKIGGCNLYDTFIHLDNYEDKFGYKVFVLRDYRKEKY